MHHHFRAGGNLGHESRRQPARVEVNDVRAERAQRVRKAQRTPDVRTAAMPPDCTDIYSETPQVVTNRSVFAEEYDGKPVTTDIHGFREVHHRERDTARMLVARSENVNDMSGSQARTAVRILWSTLFP